MRIVYVYLFRHHITQSFLLSTSAPDVLLSRVIQMSILVFCLYRWIQPLIYGAYFGCVKIYKSYANNYIGTAGIEPAQWLFPCFCCWDRSIQSQRLPQINSVLLPITCPCKRVPNTLRSEMHHIPKGAPYFCIARPLHFQISHSTGFLDTNRRRIRLFLPCIPFMKG